MRMRSSSYPFSFFLTLALPRDGLEDEGRQLRARRVRYALDSLLLLSREAKVDVLRATLGGGEFFGHAIPDTARVALAQARLCLHAHTPRATAPSVTPDTASVRVRICKCGHEESCHDGNGCHYGHGTASGGCVECSRFRVRGRAGIRAVLVPPATTLDALLREMVRAEVARQLVPRAAPTPRPPMPRAIKMTNGHGLPKCDRAILIALVTYGPSTDRRLSILTRYARSGSFTAALARLRAAGFITTASGEGISATTAGTAHLGPVEPLPRGAALLDYWIDRCGPCGGSILDVLVRAYPAEISSDRLAEATHYKLSGSFTAALAELRALGLVDGHCASNDFMHLVRGTSLR